MLKYVKPKNFKRFGEQFEDKHYLEAQNKIDIVKELTDEMKEFIKTRFHNLSSDRLRISLSTNNCYWNTPIFTIRNK